MQLAYKEKYKNNPEKYKNNFNTNIKYWLNKTNGNLEEAQELLKERQATNSLQTYVKRYGDLGYNKFKKRNKEWSNLIESKYKNNEFSKHPINCNYVSSKIETKFLSYIIKYLKKII
jgi:hypothetical protein